MNPTVGNWSGLGKDTESGVIRLKIWESDQILHGIALVKSNTGNIAIVELLGKEENESKSTFELTGFISSNPDAPPVTNAQIFTELKNDESELHINWSTSDGVFGTGVLRKAQFWANFYLNLPSYFHKTNTYLRKLLRSNFKYIYFLLVLLVVLLPIFGFVSNRLSVVEALILSAPLIFLFRGELRKFAKDMQLSKLGPIEFQEQTSRATDIEKIKHLITEKYTPDKAALLLTLSEFYVLNTKRVLWAIHMQNKYISMEEFKVLCKQQGIAEDNINTTLEALINGLVLGRDNSNMLYLTNNGKEYLEFEQQKMEILNKESL